MESDALAKIAETFQVDVPVYLILARGTIMYFGLLVLLRLFKRGSSNMAISDMLLMVLLADASQNAMAGEYKSVTSGIILVSTLLFWNLVVDWLSYKFPLVSRLTHPPRQLLIEDGKMIKHNMRGQMVTKEELIAHLHENGIDEVSKVKKAFLEANGQLSVIPKKEG